MVHLPHLVDGAVPSDMALASPEGLAEERRLFYVAVTRARDELYLYAPLRLHLHRMAATTGTGTRSSPGSSTPGAQARCELVDVTPREPVVPTMAQLAVHVDAALESLLARPEERGSQSAASMTGRAGRRPARRAGGRRRSR